RNIEVVTPRRRRIGGRAVRPHPVAKRVFLPFEGAVLARLLRKCFSCAHRPLSPAPATTQPRAPETRRNRKPAGVSRRGTQPPTAPPSAPAGGEPAWSCVRS